MKKPLKGLLALAGIPALYLGAVLPGKRSMKRTIFPRRYYAHRGLFDNRGAAPENSLPAFERAIRHGFGIELDVQLTKDRIPVVFHDDYLGRACGIKGKISDYTYEQLREFTLFNSEERIPLFKEVLSRVDGKTPLIVELKMPGTDPEVCKIADRLLSSYEGAYCIESFNPLALLWYRKNRPHVIRGQLGQVYGRHQKKSSLHRDLFLILHGRLVFNFITKPDFIAYDCRDHMEFSRTLCRKLFHHPAVAWTVKSQEQLDSIRSAYDVFIFDNFVPM